MPACSANIVATLNLTGQTSAISPTNLFTPSADGLFRVSVYIEVTGSGVATVDFPYTDGIGGNEVGAIGGSGGSGQGNHWCIRATSGNPIQYETHINSGSPTYSLFMAVEQIS